MCEPTSTIAAVKHTLHLVLPRCHFKDSFQVRFLQSSVTVLDRGVEEMGPYTVNLDHGVTDYGENSTKI